MIHLRRFGRFQENCSIEGNTWNRSAITTLNKFSLSLEMPYASYAQLSGPLSKKRQRELLGSVWSNFAAGCPRRRGSMGRMTNLNRKDIYPPAHTMSNICMYWFMQLDVISKWTSWTSLVHDLRQTNYMTPSPLRLDVGNLPTPWPSKAGQLFQLVLWGSWKVLLFSIFRDRRLDELNCLVLGKVMDWAQLASWCSKFPNFLNLFDTFVKGWPSNFKIMSLTIGEDMTKQQCYLNVS